MPNLYNLRLMAPGHFCMAKFDEDFNVAAVYTLMQRPRGWSCDCPAGQRSVKLKPCKHQRMMPFMLGAVNTNRFYEPESGAWDEPLAKDPAVIDQKGVEMSLPKGVQAMTLDDPAAVHNAIAEAVGEPEVRFLDEKKAGAVIEQSGLTPEEAVYGFTPEPPKPPRPASSNPIVTRRI